MKWVLLVVLLAGVGFGGWKILSKFRAPSATENVETSTGQGDTVAPVAVEEPEIGTAVAPGSHAAGSVPQARADQRPYTPPAKITAPTSVSPDPFDAPPPESVQIPTVGPDGPSNNSRMARRPNGDDETNPTGTGGGPPPGYDSSSAVPPPQVPYDPPSDDFLDSPPPDAAFGDPEEVY